MVELVSNGTNSNTVQTCQIFWIVKNSIKIIAICSQTMNEDVPLRYNGVPKTSAVVLDFRKKGRQLLLVANYLDRMIVHRLSIEKGVCCRVTPIFVQSEIFCS